MANSLNWLQLGVLTAFPTMPARKEQRNWLGGTPTGAQTEDRTGTWEIDKSRPIYI